MSQLLTVKEIAELLSVNPAMVRRLIKNGKIRGCNIGGYKATSEAVANYVKSREIVAAVVAK
ncbi:helix-turn-helix domain-containing protein [Ktedonobacteria bacterium brp13]|nr:helix-turn-helix domain-containing protein [Ktedonobacteria bacterium brp13]